ncbi:MAG TPA: hypothetical protein VK021_09815, partial [Flavobacteriaceae bacterium]|nr:hypothetical protein [Flavobacteriaceae bacterium]
MKNIFYKVSLVFFVFSLGACQNDDFIESQADETEDRNYTEFGTGSIYGISIDNGVSLESKNNILVFPDWDTFKQTSIDLDKQREFAIEMMNQNAGDKMSDEEYKIYIDSLGFNENQVYINFEDQFEFYALRREINKRELQWLSRRSDSEDWNEATLNDPVPDDSFVWEEERSLLNPQFEVIVKNEQKEDIIYKWYPNGYYAEIKNMNELVLQQINTSGPVQNSDVKWVYSENPSENNYGNTPPLQHFPDPNYGYGSDINPDNSDPCIMNNTKFTKRLKIKKRRRIKVIQRTRHRTLFYEPKVRATTKYYHKFVFWLPDISRVGAELHTNYPLTCDHIGLMPNPKAKYMKAHSVSVSWGPIDIGNSHVPRLTPDNTYSQHRRFDFIREIDFYSREITEI